MRLRNILPILLLGIPTPCNKPIVHKALPKVQKELVKTVKPTLEKDIKFQEILEDTFSLRYSDEVKIVEYNKLLKKYNKPTSNYIVIDKHRCRAYVYNPDGELLLDEEVLLGRHFGDKRSGGYTHRELRQSFTTAPGEFIVSQVGSKNNKKNQKLYGERLLIISGDHTLKESARYETIALHQVPNSTWGKERYQRFNNGNLEDNRRSYGCINLLPEAFDSLRTKIKGLGTKVYILPEEDINSLYLEKQGKGYKFFQKKYRLEAQEMNDSISINA